MDVAPKRLAGPARIAPSPSTSGRELLTALWCVAAYQLVHHPGMGAPVRSYGRPLLPCVLIGLGVYLLLVHAPLMPLL